MPDRWNILECLSILCALCLFVPSMHAGNPTNEPAAVLELREAQELRRGAERKLAEAEAALATAEQEAEGLRRRYADLYLESRQQALALEHIELRIAGLLTDREDVSSGRALAKTLSALDDMQTRLHGLQAGVREFGDFLNSVLDILQPSDGLRRDVTARFEALKAAVERTAQAPLPTVAGRGGGEQLRRTCRVLAVNDDLQVVVLDSGHNDGVAPGSTWQVLSGERVVARLRVVEVRPAVSAAVLIDGRLKAVAQGAPVSAASD